VTATDTNGVVTITNTSAAPIPCRSPRRWDRPWAEPPTVRLRRHSFGLTTIAAKGTLVVDEKVAPTITSANAATSIVGTPFSFTVHTTGAPSPALSFTGSLPTGIAFLDNATGTATISGTAAAGTGGHVRDHHHRRVERRTTDSVIHVDQRPSSHHHQCGGRAVLHGLCQYVHSDDDRFANADDRRTGALPSTMTFKTTGTARRPSPVLRRWIDGTIRPTREKALAVPRRWTW